MTTRDKGITLAPAQISLDASIFGTDVAAIQTAATKAVSYGCGRIYVSKAFSTSIDLSTLSLPSTIIVEDARYNTSGHTVYFNSGADVELRIHGASTSSGEGPSFVGVNTATAGDRTVSFVARYGGSAGSNVNSYIHFGRWDGTNWYQDIDYILKGSDGFRSRVRMGADGAVLLNPSNTGFQIDPAVAYAANYTLVVTAPAQSASPGKYLFGVNSAFVEIPTELRLVAANAAARWQNAAGANRFSLLSDYPSAEQFTLYDHVAGKNVMIFTSGGVFSFTGGITMVAQTAASAPNGTLFVDSADNKLKYKGSAGTLTALANP